MRLKKYFEWSRERSNIISKKYIAFWILGFFAFLWVLIRSGTNPKRLTYPCQQAALPFASSWFIAILGIFGGLVVLKRLIRLSFALTIVILLGIFSISSVKQTRKSIISELPTWQVTDPVSIVAVIDSIPRTPGSLSAGDGSVPDSYLSDPAMDSLAILLEKLGTPLYKTSSNANGLIGANDIVVIKGNFQRGFRLGTNTDRIKGLIWLLLNHPESFTGEILVCDNTQFGDIGQSKNNSQDTLQSIVDVVNTFNAKGYPVYLEKWRDYLTIDVAEYKSGDYTTGYIYDDKTKISYPKFQTPSGMYYVSLRYGIWNSENSTYDSSRLSIINFPVLKAHGAAGATVAIKNWVGVLTTADKENRYGGSENMHFGYFWSEYALVARIMALTYPKLNIIDATWTSAKNNFEYHPEYTYNTGKLIASIDPVAASWYAAKYILLPLAVSPYNVKPDDPNSKYGTIIRRWYNYLSDSAGLQCTLDSSQISVYTNASLNVSTYLDANPNSVNVDCESGTTSFNVSTNIGWTVKDDVTWLRATKTDDSTISVSYDSNTSVDNRIAKIIVDGTGVVSETVNVMQAGQEAYIVVSPNYQIVDSESDSITFTVTSNASWSVGESSDWLSANKFNDTLLIVTFDDNNSTQERSAIISFYGKGESLETVMIVQKGSSHNVDTETFQDKNIEVYPNPTEDILIIEVHDLSEYFVEINSLNGQVLVQKHITESRNVFDLSSFQKGIYLLTIRSKDSQTTKRIIRQ